MERISFPPIFAAWQKMARTALHRELPPGAFVWEELGRDEPALDLFEENETPSASVAISRFRVPKKFVELARLISFHQDERRWALLYRLLWRLTNGEPKLLEIVIDPDVSLAFDWQKSVRHDIHKMRAFVPSAKSRGLAGSGSWRGLSRSTISLSTTPPFLSIASRR